MSCARGRTAARSLAHFPPMSAGHRGKTSSVSDTTPQTGVDRASGQVKHRPERTVEDVVVEVLVQRRHDRTDHNRALIASATRTGPERTPLPPGVRAEPATGRGGAGVSRPRRSE
jgi:hypothetical protein